MAGNWVADTTYVAYWLAGTTKANSAFTLVKTTECGPASGAL